MAEKMTMNDQGWYEVAEGPGLLQGDLLIGCPAVVPESPIQWPVSPPTQPEIRVRFFDMIVMTQSCDLANDKNPEVLLTLVASWPDVVQLESEKGNPSVKGSKFRKALVE